MSTRFTFLAAALLGLPALRAQESFSFSANLPFYGIYASDYLGGHAIPAGLTSGLSRAYYRIESADLIPTLLQPAGGTIAALKVETTPTSFTSLSAALTLYGFSANDLTMKFGTLDLGQDREGYEWYASGEVETRHYSGNTYTFYLDGQALVSGIMPTMQLITDYNDPVNLLDDEVAVVTSYTGVEDASVLSSPNVRACAQALLDDIAGRGIRFRYEALQQTPIGSTGLLFGSSVGYVDIGPAFDADLPASKVAAGQAGTCVSAASVVSTGSGIWKHFFVGSDRVASFFDNESLGNVTASVHRNAGPIRTLGQGVELLDRNVVITPENQPAGKVRVRLYYTAEDWSALLAANDDDRNDPAHAGAIRVRKLASDVCNGSIPSAPERFLKVLDHGLVGADHYCDVEVESFSDFYVEGEEQQPLPVQLTHFAATPQRAGVDLEWSTAQELNTDRFEIERSENASDWKTIATVPAAGNTKFTTQYRHTDKVRLSGKTVYYRLRDVDFDGTSEVSVVRAVSGAAELSKRAWPNPVAAGEAVSTNFTVGEEVVAYDFGGRQVGRFGVAAGGSVSLSGLPAGSYVLRQGAAFARVALR